jgi:hypothetical protein
MNLRFFVFFQRVSTRLTKDLASRQSDILSGLADPQQVMNMSAIPRRIYIVCWAQPRGECHSFVT